MDNQQSERFQQWLPNNDVNGRAVREYASGVQSVQGFLGVEHIEELFDSIGLERTLERINPDTIPRAQGTIENYQSYVTKYHDFLRAQ